MSLLNGHMLHHFIVIDIMNYIVSSCTFYNLNCSCTIECTYKHKIKCTVYIFMGDMVFWPFSNKKRMMRRDHFQSI